MAKRVAVVGLSFRFPGTTTDGYWKDLLEGKDLVTQVDPQRWSTDPYLHPDKNHPGTAYTFAAGSIGDISKFDAAFFGISPREAALMDPQQRLLLEMCWEAIEHAGIKPSSLRGSDTGVYIGISSADYAYRLSDDFDAIDASFATGNTSSIAANRLSYVFDLRGPSMAVDTACSSSLVAFHQACQAIESGEITYAISGGVSLHLHPYGFITFSKASMLSRKGRCNVFDADGDGYVRSEGGGLFLLKDYDAAVADGDRIVGVIAHTAVNTDGRKSGLTVPSAEAQVALMARAYAQVGILPQDIDYLEAHGTGTAVGDPIESHAIGLALGQQRTTPLPIGSIKSNMGHLEAASGVAGLVKALYCLNKREVPATIGIKTLNPNIKFNEWNLDVVTETRALKAKGLLTIGVNSFGFGGANAHVILQNHERTSQNTSGLMTATGLPIIVSGKTPEALIDAAQSYANTLKDLPPSALYDFAYHAALRRDWHEHRAIVCKASAKALANSLRAFASGRSDKHELAVGTAVSAPKGAVFVYSGNGSQWLGMGRALLGDPIFAEAVSDIDVEFAPLAGYRLFDDLSGKSDASRGDGYHRTEFAQPALFAIQVGITRMFAHRGIRPSAVVGHSVGEVAAAWASGILSLSQATQVIFHRSRLQGTTRGNGAMTAVGINGTQTTELLASLGLENTVSVAGFNSDRGATVAGHPDDLRVLESALGAKRISHKRLDLDYAFHSPAMDPIKQPLLDVLAPMVSSPAIIPFYSAVTGEILAGTPLNADYWWRNIRDSVRFEQATKASISDGLNIFVEIGPHSVLRNYVNDALKAADVDGRVLTTGARGDSSPEKIENAANQAIIAGVEVQWETYFPAVGRHLTLPAYPWQRETHWHPVSPEAGNALNRVRVHPLLGYPLPHHKATWENQLDTSRCPTLGDHIVGEATVLPGAAFVEIALAAAFNNHDVPFAEIEEIDIRAPLLLEANATKVIRTVIEASDGKLIIEAKTQSSDDDFTTHAVARVLSESKGVGLIDSTPIWPARAPDFTGEDHAALTTAAGLSYGPAYQAITSGWNESEHSVIARFTADTSIGPELAQSHIHPALLDCTFQLIIQLLKHDTSLHNGTAFVPAKIGRVIVRAGAHNVHSARATLLRRTPHALVARFALFDENGVQIAAVEEARFRSIRLKKAALDSLSFLDFIAVPAPRESIHKGMPFSLDAEQLADGIQDCVRGQDSSTHRLRFSSEVEPLADALCNQFMREALQAIADKPGRLSSGRVQALRSAHPDQAVLLNTILARMVEEGSASVTSGGWNLADISDQPTAIDIWNSLLREYPDYFAIVQAIGRVGQHLPALLQQTQSLADVCPREATPESLATHIQGLTIRQDLAKYLSRFSLEVEKTLPPGRRYGLLEIGGAAPLLAQDYCNVVDANLCDYHFASVNSEALATARRLLETWPDTHVEDIRSTNPPTVVHADLVFVDISMLGLQDARRSLKYAHERLAVGGVLIVLNTHPAAWLDVIFGATPDWWEDANDAGKVSRQQSLPFWIAELKALGLDVNTSNSEALDVLSGAYTLLARKAVAAALSKPRNAGARIAAPASVDKHAPKLEHPLWLVLADQSDVSRRAVVHLRKQLTSQQHRVQVYTPEWLTDANDIGTSGESDAKSTAVAQDSGVSPSCAPMISLMNTVTSEHGAISAIVHLYGLDTPASAEEALSIQVERCTLAAHITQACESLGSAMNVWLVTQNAEVAIADARDRAHGSRNQQAASSLDKEAQAHDAALWGFGRTMMNEASTLRVGMIDLATNPDGLSDALLTAFAHEITSPDDDQEVLLRVLPEGVVRRVPRLSSVSRPRPGLAQDESDVATDGTLRLGFEFPGQLRNLRWELHAAVQPDVDEVEIDVHATGLNFRDVMYALGMLSDEAIENGFAGPSLGLEFGGTVRRLGANVTGFKPGDRVVGFGPSSFGNRTLTKVSAISHMPQGMSFEAAATIPSTFFTVYYAFHHLAHLMPGEKVLIHGAAGGVGIAAIQYAQYIGAEIYATAGSAEKRDFLRLMGVTNVYDSRSLAFADDILNATDGQGVDVVLNSLAGEAVNRNFRVLKPFGRFLELGKRDFYENTRIGLRPFRNNISYFGIDADQLMHARPDLTQRLFAEMMALFEQGALHPLPYRVFDAAAVVDSFRYMQQARQIGKIVVTYRNGLRPSHVQIERRKPVRLELDPTASYLVTGGLGGFGLRTAQWLVERGARHLILISRSGASSSEAQAALSDFAAHGVSVHAAACDVTDKTALSKTLAKAAADMPQLKGTVHAAVVIDDGLIRNMTAAQIRRTMAAKLLGAQNLHDLTQAIPLDLFIVFSSATTLLGNPGQANYVAANCWLEAFAAQRRKAGLEATCVKWGAIDDVGFLAQNTKIKDALQSRIGGNAIASATALRALEDVVLSKRSNLGVMELDWRALSRFLPSAQQPKFSGIARRSKHDGGDDNQSDDIALWVATLPEAELNTRFIEILRHEVGDILRVVPEKIDPNQSIYDMGLDSLMGVELVVALEGRFGVRLPVMALNDSPTLAKLAERLVRMLSGQDGVDDATIEDSARAQIHQIAHQHNADISTEAIDALAAEIAQASDQPNRMIL